jgi:hypothetical protein
MTDSTGIFQHASFTTPNLSEGYCTDDNARALILAVLLGQLEEAPKRVRALAATYAAFLNYAFDPRTARVHNFLSVGRRWLDEQGSDDCHGRASWALGTAVGRSPHWSSQMVAEQLFAQALPPVTDFTSPRAWAFSLIGIHEYLRRLKGGRLAKDVREELTKRLVAIFDKMAEPEWSWFQEGLTCDSAKLEAYGLCAGLWAYRPHSVVNSGLLAATDSIGGTAHAPTSTSSPSRRRPRYRPAWRRTALRPARGGMNRRNAPSTGASAGTISGWSSTPAGPAAAAMGCTRTGATKTRERSRCWPFSFRLRKCG